MFKTRLLASTEFLAKPPYADIPEHPSCL